MRASLGFVMLLLAAHAAAQTPTIADIEHFTENRGWNEAGLGPTYQTVVAARVEPFGFPTLAFAEQDGVREPMVHFGGDLYVLWKRFDPGLTGSWRIVAERGDASSASALSPPLISAQEVPLATDVRVAGKGAQPTVRWKLPPLAGFDVDRVRVGVRGGHRIQGRFLALLHVSDPLPPGATSFRVPRGWLEPGRSYVFQVMLEDLELGTVENRSVAFSDPYTPRQALR